MDYELNVFPSNEKDLQNVKALNNTKTIKIVQEGKLPQMYKKSFGAAVKLHDERAVSGKLIEDYYKSIVQSNVPEVYKMTLIIRYELRNQNDMAAIQKAFTDFKKLLEKETYLAIVSTYIMSYDEFKELQIYFYPVVDGYVTGLSIRNDLIDLVKKLTDSKEDMNIAKAMPLFVDHMINLFDAVNQGQFLSEHELEAKARNFKDENPFSVHAIAVETLRAQMNDLQKINAENQQLERAIQSEKERIVHDIEWSKETEKKIYKAEEERLEEERRREEEARRKEAERRALEAQRREEERLREEARRIEAERLAEQARRNIELRKQMEAQEEADRKKRMSRQLLTAESFSRLVEQHIRWQEVYEIKEDTNFDQLPEHVLKDVRRLSLTSSDIQDASFEQPIFLFGVKLSDCEFTNCRFSVQLVSSTLEHCVFVTSDLFDIQIDKCSLTGINLERLSVENVQLNDSTVIQSNFKMATIQNLIAAPATSFIRCDFANAEFRQCDMKKNAFAGCDFTNTNFVACDMRDSAFQVCKLEGIQKEGSLFKGAKASQN